MHEIKNLTNSPYDLETVEHGKPVRIPAMGSVKGRFTPEMLVGLRGLGMFTVTKIPDEPVPATRTTKRKSKEPQ